LIIPQEITTKPNNISARIIVKFKQK